MENKKIKATNTNTNTNNNEMEDKKMEKVYTLDTLKETMKKADAVKVATGEIIAKEYLDALQAMDEAFAGYNHATLDNVFAGLDSLPAFFTMGEYTALYARYDKAHACHVATGRATRLPVGDFIKAKGDALPGADAFTAAVKGLVDALKAFILSEVSYDPGKGGKKAVNISVPVEALKKVVDAVGLPEVYARPRDIRFLTMAVTGGASTIGCLSRVTKSAVETYLVDMFRVQLTKTGYAFEKVEKKEKAGK